MPGSRVYAIARWALPGTYNSVCMANVAGLLSHNVKFFDFRFLYA